MRLFFQMQLLSKICNTRALFRCIWAIRGMGVCRSLRLVASGISQKKNLSYSCFYKIFSPIVVCEEEASCIKLLASCIKFQSCVVKDWIIFLPNVLISHSIYMRQTQYIHRLLKFSIISSPHLTQPFLADFIWSCPQIELHLMRFTWGWPVQPRLRQLPRGALSNIFFLMAYSCASHIIVTTVITASQ